MKRNLTNYSDLNISQIKCLLRTKKIKYKLTILTLNLVFLLFVETVNQPSYKLFTESFLYLLINETADL